ncbi:MAG TPA: DUF2470 domain-containing protein [Pseudonocardia sp.]|uniref:DUF2470 domain-containing protein n=1 Tax=Pseudonocardia sp. TaxID=60912 RepID=UPI002CBA1838|nr:DUF2470 domain-containing protein [Pseudonocardia sp.]HTF53026.1 DUF2470 domain-containing protein [Pseudonocardia sp.]
MPDPSVSAPTGGRLGDHAVPASALAATKRTLDATPGLVGEPSDAERARTLVVESRTATLSTPGEYRRAEPDPPRPHRIGILEHMNDDHADSLLAFCRVLAGRADTVSARMLDVDRYGFSVLASTAGDGAGGGGGNGGGKAVRFGFDAPTDTPLAVRTAMIELVRRVRA